MVALRKKNKRYLDMFDIFVYSDENIFFSLLSLIDACVASSNEIEFDHEFLSFYTVKL